MKRFISAVLSAAIFFCLTLPLIPRADAVDEKIEEALQWAIATAEDRRCGYSQQNRTGPNYDCSSFVSAALMAAGFEIDDYLNTSSLPDALTELGFVRFRRGEVTPSRGDILFAPGRHVEFCLGDGQCVSAHQDYDGRSGDSRGKEIEVRDLQDCFFCRREQYTWIYRYLPAKPFLDDEGSAEEPLRMPE